MCAAVPYTVAKFQTLSPSPLCSILYRPRVSLRIWCCRELCNECHTDDNYESKLGLTPGNLTYNFQVVSRCNPPRFNVCSVSIMGSQT